MKKQWLKERTLIRKLLYLFHVKYTFKAIDDEKQNKEALTFWSLLEAMNHNVVS